VDFACDHTRRQEGTEKLIEQKTDLDKGARFALDQQVVDALRTDHEKGISGSDEGGRSTAPGRRIKQSTCQSLYREPAAAEEHAKQLDIVRDGRSDLDGQSQQSTA
jgi:hypothetical protein